MFIILFVAAVLLLLGVLRGVIKIAVLGFLALGFLLLFGLRLVLGVIVLGFLGLPLLLVLFLLAALWMGFSMKARRYREERWERKTGWKDW